MRLAARRTHRRAVNVVETAVVISLTLLLLFGILEYARFTMMVQLVDNAAREGGRYAAVADDTTTVTDIRNRVMQFLSGQTGQMRAPDGTSAFDPAQHILVYKADPANANPLDVNNNVVAVAGAAQFYQTSFAQGVTVKITATYKPVLPSFLMMNATIPMNGHSLVLSEAN